MHGGSLSDDPEFGLSGLRTPDFSVDSRDFIVEELEDGVRGKRWGKLG